MTRRGLERLGDNPDLTPPYQYYTASEFLIWLNAVQRLFVLFTFDLEANVVFPIANDGTAFYRMLLYYSDWMMPLRVRVTGGYKLRPVRMSDLGALNAQWSATRGTPEKYALLGFDLLGIYKQPTSPTTLDITYARTPAPMVLETDVPEIPEDYHPVLIDAAIVLCRTKEGAQEFAKQAPLWDRFLDACKKHAAYVRARNVEQGYDYEPFELERFDMSRVIGIQKTQ
jgi:hypothetical protein